MFASKRAALALAAAMLVWATAKAESLKLSFATAIPADNARVTKVLKPWTARVNAAPRGKLEVETRDGPAIANLSNGYDRLVHDVVQIVFGMRGLVGGRFPLSAVPVNQLGDACA